MPKKHSGIRKDESRNTWMIATRFTTPDGKCIYIKKRGFKTESDAFEYLEIFKAQKLKEYESEKRRVSWEDATTEYMNHYSSKVKKVQLFTLNLFIMQESYVHIKIKLWNRLSLFKIYATSNNKSYLRIIHPLIRTV